MLSGWFGDVVGGKMIKFQDSFVPLHTFQSVTESTMLHPLHKKKKKVAHDGSGGGGQIVVGEVERGVLLLSFTIRSTKL